MSLHVIVGAGPVGSATARLLADRGDEVRLITRSGSGPAHPGIERVKADATDPDTLVRLTTRATAIYHCAQPAYHRWAAEFPPLNASTLHAAEATGAVLVSVGNLYLYGQVDGPITEDLPARPNSAKGRVRADLWAAQLAAHHAGRIRAAEVRGSDYLGADVVSTFTVMVLPAVLRGRRALAPADVDTPHSWTYTGDMARTLVAVADDESAWGRPWHAPTPPPMSMRELADLAATLAAAPTARTGRMPTALLRLAGLFSADAREIPEVRYQFDHPFVLDSTQATTAFGLAPTPTEEALRETITAARISSGSGRRG
ncbi:MULTISPECIES: NAD-dependent epimerase/dehydratase family protein [unclassified Kitasatospora]|uniref:NAD-dependent epimerase/dehydratase family protein n=1 Tax=unclassified Kitasatospora TaxID=2633591 RepID=UPI002473D22C|nr:NAD-dependent epimerase/dehydratase family protein [Kitasatospora sp. MAP12-44]